MVSPEQEAVGSSSLNQSEEALPVPPCTRGRAGLVLDFGAFIYLTNVYIVSALCQTHMLALHKE